MTDLRKQFGPVVALDGATWQAHSGQVTAVLGPNGAGKTTMVECCEGLRRQDSGTVRVLGADPWHSPAEHRARVGVMLQDGGLPNAARPVALLRHLSQLYAAPRPVDDLAVQLGIDRFATTPVRRLSGGSASGSHSRPRWSGHPMWSSSTSPAPASTRTRASTSGSWSGPLPTRAPQW